MEDRCIQMGTLSGGKWEKLFDESRRYYSIDGISPTIPTTGGGHHEVKIGEIKPRVVGGVGEKNFGTQYRQGNRIYDSRTIATALEASPVGNAGGYTNLYAVEEKMTGNTFPQDTLCEETTVRIRRLTERESWRLMGFDDEDYDKAEKVVSGTQLYKQAGNSIVVNVLEGILENLRPYFADD